MPFQIVRNDITRMHVDAVVNAANPTLLGGGGVDGAIHQAAGPELLEECRLLGGCKTGEAKLTRGYRLPAKYVIHTVGPVWKGGASGEETALTACYVNSLELALEHGCVTVAFPVISAGAYGYPKDQALDVAVRTIGRFLDAHEDLTVYLVVFGHAEFLNGKKLFREIQEYIDDVYAEERLHGESERARRNQSYSLPKPARPKASRPEEDIRECAAFGYGAPAADDDLLAVPDAASCVSPDWEEMLRKTDEGFSAALLRLIDQKGMTDAQCYKKANVDRKLFSKIRSNPAYRPSRPTVFAFAVALELDLGETRDLLYKAGFALSRSSRFDIVMEYFITRGNYDIYEINQVLFQFDLPLLGSGMNAC